MEGHVLALAHFGAVPARVRYDNLKPAVTGQAHSAAIQVTWLACARPGGGV